MPITHYQNISSSYQRRQRNRRIIEVIILVVFIVIPSLLLLIDKKALLNKVLSLKPGSSGFETWLNPPIKTTRNYYLFNTTNAQEFLEKAKVPLHVADSPPYTYELKTNRKGIKWSDDNKTMSYEIERIYIRDPTLFNPTSINDRGNFTNMVRTLIRSKFENIPSLATKIALEGEPPFRDNPIEILEGYVSTASKEVQKQMKGPNTDKYGLVYRQNGSRLYNMTIKTDLFEKGQMLAFASELSPFVISSSNNSHFPVYDGLTFPPMLWDRPKMNIFNSDFCRPVRIEYNGTISKFGISTIHKYILKLIDFNNCTDPNDDRTCPEVDEIDVSKCLSETLDKKTIVLSKAHFYGSSSEFVDNLNIKGFNASAEKHDSIIYFEPYTGTPIEAIYRIQMNVNAKVDSMKVNDEGNYDFKWKKCETRTLPVFWIEQRVKLLDEKLKQIRVFSLLMTLLTPWKLFPIFIGIGSLIVIIMEVFAKFRP